MNGIGRNKTQKGLVSFCIYKCMRDFKEWLKNEESCGTMGCPGHPFQQNDTPQGSAARRYPHYKLNNKGCSGTLGPCADDPSGAAGTAPTAPAAPKMRKK